MSCGSVQCGWCRRLARRIRGCRYAAVVRIGSRVGVNADTLRGWCKRADIDAGKRPGTDYASKTRPAAARTARDEALMSLSTVPQATILEIVDDIFLPLVLVR